MTDDISQSVFLSVAAESGAGVLLTFDATVDDWANFDPVTNRYREHGDWQDSFLRLTGYRRHMVPFEFIRRLAWRLGNVEGYFAGMVFLLKGARPTPPGDYTDETRVANVPAVGTYEQSWQPVAGGTIFFPPAIEDFISIVNMECNGAVVYLGRSDEEGWISRLDEDDEWFIRGDTSAIVLAVERLAREFGLPVKPGAFSAAEARRATRLVPQLNIVGGEVILLPRV